MRKTGKVYLVGAGPGDPGLITKRGADLISVADVLVVDDLVNPVLFQSTRGEINYVGKRGPGAPKGSSAVLKQSGINSLLVRKAKQGKSVVRLKGGDPIVFGRGSEELEALKKSKIRFEVVPGITSAIGVPAYAGIPITDRRWSSQVTFLTGHESAQKKFGRIDWSSLSSNETLVILMGVGKWPSIARNLLRSKWPPSKPVVAIESGTTPRQRTHLTTLKNSVHDFKKRKLVSPAVLVVGDVANLTKKFSWLKKEKPLLGRRIVITRSENQVRDFKRQLEEKGAEVLLCPTFEIEPIQDDPELARFYSSFKRGLDFNWVVFLSGHAVKTFSRGLGKFRSLMKKVRICAVGPRTKKAVQKEGWPVHKEPRVFSAQGVVSTLGSLKGKKILVPRVAGAPPEFSAALRKKGAHVTELFTYRNRVANLPSDNLKTMLLSGVDAITFTSASTVRNFASFFTRKELNQIFKKSKAVSIGPSTSKALTKFGRRGYWQAQQATTDAIISVLIRKLGIK